MAVVSPTTIAEPVVSVSRHRLAPLHIQLTHIACLLLCCLAFGGWVHVAAHLSVLAMVYFVLLLVTAYYLGRMVLRPVALPDNLTHSFSMIFLVGMLTWAILMLALHSFLPWSLPVFTILLFLCAISGQFIIYADRKPPCEERREAFVGLLVVIVSLIAATCWGQELLQPRGIDHGEIVYHHWKDYFDHSAFAMMLLSQDHLWQYGNMEISDWRTPLYHYGSYLFSATLATFGPLSAYDALVSLWTPLGTFLSGLAAFTLVAYIGRRLAGAWAAVVLLTVPDSSWYGYEVGYSSYHWLQQIHAAALYGCSSAALAVVFLWEAQRSRSRAALVLAGAFAGATFFLKAQIFVVLGPLLLWWFLLCYPPWSFKWRFLLFVAVTLLILSAFVIYNCCEAGQRIGPNEVFFEAYCKYIASEAKPNSLSILVSRGGQEVGWPWFYVASTAFVLMACYGALLAVLAILTVWSWWARKLRAYDLTPWLALSVHITYLVGLDDRFAGYIQWELIHKPLVWTYFLLMTWCVGKFLVLVDAGRWLPWGMRVAMVTLGAALLLAVPWYLGRDIQRGRSEWNSGYTYYRFDEGLVDCARYINANSDRRDIIQDSHYDGRLLLISQAERRAYLGRYDLMKDSKHMPTVTEVDRRFALLESVKSMTTVEELRNFVAETHIRWFVTHPNDHYPWPAEILNAPSYESNGYAVYDFSKCIPASD